MQQNHPKTWAVGEPCASRADSPPEGKWQGCDPWPLREVEKKGKGRNSHPYPLREGGKKGKFPSKASSTLVHGPGEEERSVRGVQPASASSCLREGDVRKRDPSQIHPRGAGASSRQLQAAASRSLCSVSAHNKAQALLPT